jgi:hypothetical protein
MHETEAGPALAPSPVHPVTVRDERNLRGGGLLTVDGADRDSVQATALRAFGALQANWRDPSYPTTYPGPDGGWRATISYWSCE